MFSVTHDKSPRLSEFDLDIPESLIAQHPAPQRDQCRLMVVKRKTQTIGSHRFDQIIDYLHDGDVLILNDTQVFPARLSATKERTGSHIEIFLLRELENDLWEVLVKPSRKVRVGNTLELSDGVRCEVVDHTLDGGRIVRFQYQSDSFYDFLERHGESPLPPYIRREVEPNDKEAYQTVFAKHRGAVAAPTAGLHFTRALLADLADQGVKIGYLTLHVGLGTFKPVRVENVARHHMDAEYYHVSQATADLVNQARTNGNQVVAVGTTATRALETVAFRQSQITRGEGWTDKFIYPPYNFKIVTGLLTNFHQPKSTLIMLAAAFAGKSLLFKSYRQAIREQYQFYSYGDAMLVL